jgi:uncharacterized protein YkwD
MRLRFVTMVMVLGSWVVLAGGRAEGKSPAGDSSTSRETAKLVAEFRRAKGDAEKQGEVVDKAIAAGPGAVAAIQKLIFRELHPQLDRYRVRFQQQATGLAKNHIRKADLSEISRLRVPILALSKGEPTHEELVAKGDPALARLTEIFVVNRSDVLAQSEDLQANRQQIEALGKLWERCLAAQQQSAPAEGESKKPFTFEEYLAGEEELAAGLAVPMDPKTQQVLAVNTRLAGQLDPEEARTVLALNLTRNLLGLPALVIDLKLAAAARDHSKDMEEKKFFAHESPVPGKKTPWDRAARFGTSASGENIFMGSPDGKAANMAWFHSPGHFKNMMGDHQRVGVGRSGVYFTEEFGK